MKNPTDAIIPVIISIETIPHSMDLRAVFHSVDKDGDGRLSAAELALCVASTGAEFSLEDAEALVGGVGGALDFEAFAELVAAAAEEEEERDGELRAAFTVYEQEGEGSITPWSLRRTLSRLGEKRDIDECCSMICRFDLDGDGVISFEEFRSMMTVVQSS